MSWRVALVPRPLASISWTSLPDEKRAGGSVCLVGAVGIPEVERLPFGERGHLLVLLEAVRIHAAIARLDEHVTAGGECLACDIERDLGGLEDRGLGQRRHEAAADEAVELPLLGAKLVGIGRARGIDGRVVGRLLLAARCREFAFGEQLLGALAEIGNLGENAEDLARSRLSG